MSARRGWFDRENVELPANLRGYEYLEYHDRSGLKRRLTEWAAQTLERSSNQVARRWGSTADQLLALLAAHPNLSMNEIASRAGEHIAIVRLTITELRKRVW